VLIRALPRRKRLPVKVAAAKFGQRRFNAGGTIFPKPVRSYNRNRSLTSPVLR